MDMLDGMLTPGVQAVLVNMHETSTGYLYDIEEIGKLVRSRGALFIVDAVSAIGADPFQMDDWRVDCALVSTQKALALMPGLGYIAFGPRAMERMAHVKRGRYYFDAADYLRNMERGMTPFTPAMIAIMQVEERMKEIKAMGLDSWIGRHADRARVFRTALFDGSGEFSLFPQRSSNAMSAVALPPDVAADSIIAYMRDNYDWWFAPNPTKSLHYLRISHMGDLSGELLKLAAVRIIEAVEHIRKRGRA
jgi:aspartate aminotransferase-like enzyme